MNTEEIKKFESGILEYLEIQQTGMINILSDFYDECISLMGLTFQTSEYINNTRKIRYRLKKMKEKGLID